MNKIERRFILGWNSNDDFGKGFQALSESIETFTDGVNIDTQIRYHYGNWYRDKPEKQWYIDELNLNFQKFTLPYYPTFFEQMKYQLFKKEYPKYKENRPKDNSVVIAKYLNGEHYEVIEYDNHTWITELSFPVKPDGFAYIPESILKETEQND